MTAIFKHSKIYAGNVVHRRFSPKKHSFDYSLYMLALDVDEISQAAQQHQGFGLLGFSWFHPLRFVEKDYLRNEPFQLRERITNKVQELHGHADISRIMILVQVRCFGIYFSPVNFYFCYDRNNNCTQMLAEVSNTPWNERHYYLVDLISEAQQVNKKNFQVSPFMDLDMSYFWQVKPPSDQNSKLVVTIENKRINSASKDVEKLFDASLVLEKQPLTQRHLLRIWTQLPAMTVKIVSSIYWQALKIWLKRIPFIGYQKTVE